MLGQKQKRIKQLEQLIEYKKQELADCVRNLRPYAECYKRVCESLGIERNILGYIEKLSKQRDDLLEICEGLLYNIVERFNLHDIDCATQAATVADEFAAMGCTCWRNKAKQVIAIAKAESKD